MSPEKFVPISLDKLILSMAERQFEANELEFTSYRPTIIILLGGTGLKIGRRIKKLLRHLFRQEHLGVFQIICFDTAPEETPEGEEPLDPGEFVYFGPVDIGAQIKHLEENPTIAEWWPGTAEGHPHSVTFSGTGSHRDRTVGRLVLFNYMSNLVIPRLEMAIDRAIQIQAQNGMGVPSIKVYVISSLSGGTGGSQIVDISYVARMLGLRRQHNVFVTGVLVGDTPFTAMAQSARSVMELRANTMATLLELNHFSRVGEFVEAYDGVTNTQEMNGFYKPMDICYLVGLHNMNGQALENYDAVCEMSAAQVILEIASPMAELTGNRFDNIRATDQEIAGQPTFLSSFAVGSINYPLEGVCSWCAVKAYRAFALQVLLTNRHLAEDVDAGVLSFMQSSSIEVEQAQLLYERLQQDRDGVMINPPSLSYDQVNDLGDEQLQGGLQRLEQEALGTLARNRELIAARATPLFKQVQQSLRQEINRLLTSPQYGPAFTARLLKALVERMQSQLDHLILEQQAVLQADMQAQQQAWNAAEETLAKAIRSSSLNPLRSGKIKSSRLAYIAAFNAYLAAAQNLEVRTQAVQCMTDAIRFTQDQLRKADRLLGDWLDITERIEQESATDYVQKVATEAQYSLVHNIITGEELQQTFAQYLPDLSTTARIEYQASAFWSAFRTFNPSWSLDRYEDRNSKDSPIVQLYHYLAGQYAEQLQGQTLLQHLLRLYGKDWREVIELRSKQTSPFWAYSDGRYSHDLRANLQFEPRLIAYGEPAINWGETVQQIVAANVETVNNNNAHEMVILNTAHGLPLFALRSVEQTLLPAYKYMLDQWKNRRGNNRALPLHVSEAWLRSLSSFLPVNPARPATIAPATELTVKGNGHTPVSQAPLAG
jgi:hypothetical protein